MMMIAEGKGSIWLMDATCYIIDVESGKASRARPEMASLQVRVRLYVEKHYLLHLGVAFVLFTTEKQVSVLLPVGLHLSVPTVRSAAMTHKY